MPSAPRGGTGRNHAPSLDFLPGSCGSISLQPTSSHIVLKIHTPPNRYFQGTYPVPPEPLCPWAPLHMVGLRIRTRLCACWCFQLFMFPAPAGGAASTSRAGVRLYLHPANSGCSGELRTQMDKPEEAAQNGSRLRFWSQVTWA